MIYELTDRWRSDLMFYCGVEIVSENEYSEKLENGEYDIALIELGAEQNSAYEFLKNMKIRASGAMRIRNSCPTLQPRLRR